MREQLGTLFLGIGIIVVGGLGYAFYQSLDLTKTTNNGTVVNINDNRSPINTNLELINASANQITILVGTSTLRLEIASTPEARERGLGGRAALGPNEGMLFIFDTPDFPGFWMKEMNFALDLIWLNEQGEIVEITKNASPDSYPTLFYPPAPIKYVIEVPAGWSEKNNLEVGDILESIL